MRSALFSDKEREILTEFLGEGGESTIFRRVLFHRVRRYQTQITKDYDLMAKVLYYLTILGK